MTRFRHTYKLLLCAALTGMLLLCCPSFACASAPADSTEVSVQIAEDSILITENSIDSLIHVAIEGKKDRFVPDPIRSMWLAMVFPGGGQIYNRKLWKLPIIYGGFLGCAYALTWNNQMLHDYSQAYLDIMDNDPNTKSFEKMLPMGYDITGREDRFKEIFKNKKNYFRKYRDMSIFAFAGVYLLSVIDAYVDGELSTFDISEDLSFHVAPTMIQSPCTAAGNRQFTPGVQCSFNF